MQVSMRFISTYTTPYDFWREAVHPVSRRSHSSLSVIRKLVLEAPDYEVAILNGAAGARQLYSDVVAASLIARRGIPVLLAEAQWEAGSRSLSGRPSREPVDVAPETGAALIRCLIRMFDTRRTHYGVLSTYERDRFPRYWGIDPARVHFTPFCVTQPSTPVQSIDRHVFAGGNSLRDYRSLIAAAPHINGNVRVATYLGTAYTTGNLTVGPMDGDAYAEAARTAAVMVVALMADTVRSAGQQTYLNAMMQGQPVVATDAPGVRDYIEDGRTGLIVPPGDDIAMARTVNSLLDDPSLAQRIGGAAQEAVKRTYKTSDYFERLLSAAASLAQ